MITTALYLLASACPVLLVAMRALAVRSARPAFTLKLDLVLLLIGFVVGIWLVAKVEALPTSGDHNPGVGVVFIPLMLVSIACLTVWMLRVVVATVRARRNRS